jgi:hypothetical protein
MVRKSKFVTCVQDICGSNTENTIACSEGCFSLFYSFFDSNNELFPKKDRKNASSQIVTVSKFIPVFQFLSTIHPL